MSSRNIRLVIVLVVLATALVWADASFFSRRSSPGPASERAAVFPAPSPKREAVRGGPPPRKLELLSSSAAAAVSPIALAPGEEPPSVPARLSFASAWGCAQQPELMAFEAWAGRYLAAPRAARGALAVKGATLALARRGALAGLIKTDPQRAIAAAVPLAVRTQLPPEIAAYLEERVAGTGNLELLAVTPAPGQAAAEPYQKRAIVDGRTFRAYTYGRRESQATKVDTSVLGVALDGALAVSESPLRVLETGEVPAPGVSVAAACPVSGKLTPVPARTPLNVQAAVAVQVGGQVQVLCHTEHIAEYEAGLIQQETAAGPYPVQLSLNDGSSGTSNITGRPPLSWSQGTKKVLFIRVDFSDLPGTPLLTGTSQQLDDTYIVNQINQANGVRDFYLQGSYGKTTLAVAPVVSGDSPDVTTVYRLPKTAAYYAAGDANDSFDGEMHTAAEALAASGGYNLSSYDRIAVVFSNLNNLPNSKITYGGRANVQGKSFWINGYFNFGTLIHELGHTYGLQHSNLWQVSDGNPVSAAGASVEYGDPYDPMGRNVVTVANHFNQWEKSLLQWIPDAAVTTVSTAGTYRVYRFDHSSANLSNPLALKIVRNSTQDYWIGHRRALSNPALLNGAHVLWGYNAVQQSDLLDFTTPGTTPADSPLAAGTSFHDTAAGITILPIGTGGTSPNEYLDVSISFDSRVQWSSSTYSFDEKLGPATLTLQRTGNSVGAVSVNYATANGTATAPADYAAASGTVTWASGDNAPKTITIPITADALAEGLENFTVTLSGVSSGGVIVNGATATVSIADAGAADPGLNPEYINSSVKQTAVQPDGKLLIAGYFDTIYSNNTGYTRRGFARLHADGRLDQTFGIGPGAEMVPIFALALQPDGKILIGGNFATVHGVARTRVARLNTDGSLDPTFNPGAGPNAEVHALALQPDGKVLVGGIFTSMAGQPCAGIARLNADGTPDGAFAGPAFLGFPNADVVSIALQSDGRVILAGSFHFNPAPYKSGVARLNTNGSLDSTFNPGYGAHIAGDNGFLQTVQKVALQRDGKLVIGGYFTGFNNATRNRLARLNSDGTLDGGFTPAVDPSVAANTFPYPHVRTLLVQADDLILVGGSFTQVGGATRGNFARLNANGTLDASFAVGSGSSGWVNDATQQTDGRLVLGADFGTIQGAANRTVARLFSGLPGLPGAVQFGAPSYVGEEGKPFAVSVTRTGGSYGAVSVNYGTQPGTAAASRYTLANGTLSWAAGDTSAKTINLTLLNDGAAQPDQAFALNLGIPMGGVIPGAPGRTTITIRSPATNVFSNCATLNGVVNPNGAATTVYFQYGTSTGYGQTTAPQNIGSGSSKVAFSANLTGLIASKLYHYRLVSTSSAGTVTYADQTFTSAAQASDFNRDGKPDYILANPGNGQVYVFYLNGGAYAGGAPAATVPAGYLLNCAADMNGDGQTDFVLFNPSTRAVLILYLSGTAYAGYAFGPTPPADWVLVSVADFNHDGKPDYLLFNTSTRQTSIWYLNGANYAGSATGPTIPPGLTLLKAADFNGDSKPDYVFFNPGNRQTSIWYLNGVTYAGTGYGPTTPTGWVLSGVADFNGDGMNDYVIFNPSTRQTYLWFLNGVSYSGAASAPTLPVGFNLASP